MEPRPLAGKEVVVDGFLEERVTEGVALRPRRRIRDQHLAADGLAQRLVQRRLVDGRRVGEQRGIQSLARGGGDPQELLRRLGELGDASQEHVAQRGGEIRPRVLARGRQQLLGEERVPARARVDRLDQGPIDVVAHDRPQLGADLL